MSKLIWLDDESMSISYDRDVLIPKIFGKSVKKIEFFENINELMAYIYQNKKLINDNDIFIIDIMLTLEKHILLPDSTKISIPDNLMAGATLYTEYLKNTFPKNPTILYTSREHNEELFQNILNDTRYEDTLYLIDKWKKDTTFIQTLKKFIGEEK